jgi:hypothetical protein
MQPGALAYANGVIVMMQMDGVGLERIFEPRWCV